MRNRRYTPTIKVMADCTKEWIPEESVCTLNIEEDFQGRDVLTFRCPLCKEVHKSLRVS